MHHKLGIAQASALTMPSVMEIWNVAPVVVVASACVLEKKVWKNIECRELLVLCWRWRGRGGQSYVSITTFSIFSTCNTFLNILQILRAKATSHLLSWIMSNMHGTSQAWSTNIYPVICNHHVVVKMILLWIFLIPYSLATFVVSTNCHLNTLLFALCG